MKPSQPAHSWTWPRRSCVRFGSGGLALCIPREAVRVLGLGKGSLVDVSIEGDTLRIRKAKPDVDD